MKKTLGLTLSLGFMVLAVGCSSAATPGPSPAEVMQPESPPVDLTVPDQLEVPAMMPEDMAQDLLDVAAEDGRFNTLLAALEAAGLADTLKGEGPFTLFAPTDQAFAKLPDGTVEALLEDVPALTDILLYHVVPGEVRAADVASLESADTVLDQPLTIAFQDGKVLINDSRVVVSDIQASNGLIHVIDTVLMPSNN